MIFNYWKKFCLRSNSKSEWLQSQIMNTKFFRKFVSQGKRWQRLQNRNFHQLQQIFAVARWNHPYAYLASWGNMYLHTGHTVPIYWRQYFSTVRKKSWCFFTLNTNTKQWQKQVERKFELFWISSPFFIGARFLAK